MRLGHATQEIFTPEERRRIDESVIRHFEPDKGYQELFRQRCDTLFNATIQKRRARPRPDIEHLPKTGGKTMEYFLLSHFTGHSCKKFKRHTGNFVTVLRHPIDRLLSYYHFMEGGERISRYKEYQEVHCVSGTGKFYNNRCVPKQAFFDYAVDLLHNRSLYGHEAPNYCLSGKGWDGSFQQTVSFAFRNLVLIGITEQMLTFEVMLAKAYPGKTRQPTKTVKNAVAHAALENSLTVEQYRRLAQLGKDELSLYYWASDLVGKLESCYGEVRLQSDLLNASTREYEVEVVFDAKQGGSAHRLTATGGV